MNKTTMWIAVAVVCCAAAGGGAWWYMNGSRSSSGQYSTYFNYSDQEIASVQALDASKSSTVDDVYRWDETTFDLISKDADASGFINIDPTKVFAYLAVAQRDFNNIARNLNKGGSIDPVSRDTLCLLFTKSCSSLARNVKTDDFSEAVSKLIAGKVKTRLEKDEMQMKPYADKVGPEYWDGKEPRIGQKLGSSVPWYIKSGDQFRAPPPPAFDSQELKDQLAETKKFLTEATSKQRYAVVYWAGGPGTKSTPGILLDIADKYMQKNNVDLVKVLDARAAMTAAVADAAIAAFDSKYTYWLRRPNMMDPSIITIMPTPNHPSYPSGHSTLSMAAGVVWKHYFPENNDEWDARVEEGGMSRVWGGIHYMIDHTSGQAIGKAVGEEVVKGFH